MEVHGPAPHPQKRPQRPPRIHIEVDLPPPNRKGHARRIGEVARPLEGLEGLGQQVRSRRVAHEAPVQPHGNVEGPLRVEDGVGCIDAPLLEEPGPHRLHLRGRREGRQNAHVLADADGGPARRLGRTEIAKLARVEATGLGILVPRVKLEDDSAAVADEIRIGEAAHRLKNALLVLAEARVPFSFKSAHNRVREFVVLAKDGNRKDGVKEVLEVLLLVVGLGQLVLPLKAELEGLGPVHVGRAEQHLEKEATDKASLVANVVPVRGGLEALVDPQNVFHAVGQKEGLGPRLVRHVDKGLVPQNVNNVELAKALGQEFNVLDGVPGGREGIGLEDGGLQKGHEEFGLGRFKVGEEELDDFLIRLDAEGPEDDEEGHGGSHKGEAHQNRPVLAQANRDRLDLASLGREAGNRGVNSGLGVLGVRVFRSDV